MCPVQMTDWFLSATERGNSRHGLDSRHPGGRAWTEGNTVRPLVHGATYFAELPPAARARWRPATCSCSSTGAATPTSGCSASRAPRSARCSPTRRAAVSTCGVCCGARTGTGSRSRRGEPPPRRRGQRRRGRGGARPAGAHRAARTTRSSSCCATPPARARRRLPRRDRPVPQPPRRRDPHGDPQRQPMAEVYGPRPPWHDIQLAITGPAVGDVETRLPRAVGRPAAAQPVAVPPGRRPGQAQ